MPPLLACTLAMALLAGPCLFQAAAAQPDTAQPTATQPTMAQPNAIDTAVEQARHTGATPACQALTAAAAVLVLSPAPTPAARTAAPRAVHDLLARVAAQCPDAPLASYWKGVTALALRLSPPATRSGPPTRPLPEQPLADARRIMATLNLSDDCRAALEEAAGDDLAQAAGAAGMQPALLLGDYAANRCPAAAFEALWPAVETAHATLAATPR